MAFDDQLSRSLLARAGDPQGEPLRALAALTQLRRQLELLERQQVQRALARGRTFTAIARPLEISRQAAHRRYRDLLGAPTPEPRIPTLSPRARLALQQARQEAAQLGASAVRSEHVLLGVVYTVGLPVNLAVARRLLGPSPSQPSVPTGLEPALRARLLDVDGPLLPEHLLAAALDDPDGGARRVLDRLGIDAETLRPRS